MTPKILKEYLGGERKDTLNIDKIAMKIAFICSKQSKDPSTQVGCCIVSEDERIISTGCNKAPNNWNDNKFPWGRDINKIGEENTKYPYVIHAEMSAISNCKEDLKNATIYVTLFPCSNCSKLIVASGIKRVIYSDYRDNIDAICSKRIFENCGIEYINYNEMKFEKVLKLRKENN